MASIEKPSENERAPEKEATEAAPAAPESLEPVATPEPTAEEAAQRASLIENLEANNTPSEGKSAAEPTTAAAAAQTKPATKKKEHKTHGSSEAKLGFGGFFTIFFGMILAGAASALGSLGKAAGIKFGGGGGGGGGHKASGGGHGGGGHH